MTRIKKLTSQLAKKPRALFLIDSIGALITALVLFTVLRNLHAYFGLPQSVITILFSIASCFCFYSATCLIFLKKKWMLFLRIISFANILYCFLTIVFLFIYHRGVTILGFTYFLTETAVIFTLAYVELSVSRL